MPGNTPTSVPRKVPARPYIKLVAVKAVAKPSRSKFRLFINYAPELKRFSNIPCGNRIFKPLVNAK
jgi:hypothetical protein